MVIHVKNIEASHYMKVVRCANVLDIHGGFEMKVSIHKNGIVFWHNDNLLCDIARKDGTFEEVFDTFSTLLKI